MIYKLDNLVGYDKEKELYLQKILAARKHEFNIVMNHLQEYSIATISATRAYRREAYKEYRRLYNLTIKDEVTESMLNSEPDFQQYRIGMQENIIRGRQLQQKLYKANLEAITPVFGLYYGASESSYICFHKDYLYLVETICKLGTLFEQDSVCVLRPSAKLGAMIKTSPKDINSDPQFKRGQALMRFKGLTIHNKTDIVNCCSKINNSKFSFNELALKSCRIITDIVDANYGIMSAGEARRIHYKVSANNRRISAPNHIITTAGTIFRDWHNLNKPILDRNEMDETIISALLEN